MGSVCLNFQYTKRDKKKYLEMRDILFEASLSAGQERLVNGHEKIFYSIRADCRAVLLRGLRPASRKTQFQ